MPNANLTSAKKAKNDEFYTQYSDIQKEIEAYLDYDPDTFRGKVVYCNCDDPLESNFFGFFADNFKRLGLKRLITTSYKPSPIANTLFDLSRYGEGSESKPRPKDFAARFIIDDVGDYDGDGSFTRRDLFQQLKENKHNEWQELLGDSTYPAGDFRSAECVELLKQADIVVTNPPFSLFREYVTQLVEYGKKFAIIGNMNAITYREIFPLLKDNKVWLGNNARVNGGAMFYEIPEAVVNLEQVREIRTREDGSKMYITRVQGVRWFTNLEHGRLHQPISLRDTRSIFKRPKHKVFEGKTAFDRYDNFDAIEVPYVDSIPSDYDGMIGVPISFLDKYSPDQFTIVGSYNNGEHGEELGAIKSPIEVNGRTTMWNGPVVNRKPLYKRIIIKHRKAAV